MTSHPGETSAHRQLIDTHNKLWRNKLKTFLHGANRDARVAEARLWLADVEQCLASEIAMMEVLQACSFAGMHTGGGSANSSQHEAVAKATEGLDRMRAVVKVFDEVFSKGE